MRNLTTSKVFIKKGGYYRVINWRTLGELADKLGITYPTLQVWFKDGRIESVPYTEPTDESEGTELYSDIPF